MKTVLVRTREPYPVLIGGDLLGRLPELCAKALGKERKAVIVTDPFLARGIGRKAEATFKASGWKTELFILPRGEAAKSLAALERLWGFLLRRGADRRTGVVALGGGTVGDAAGFAAAAYYRGVPLVQVPTTLLAQVDSAIGGKTAVNHALAKNAIGAFHQPRLVVCDVGVLRSLPKRDLLSGLGEVVKYALVFDRAFARRLEQDWKKILQASPTVMEEVVRKCAALKAAVVAEDVLDLSGRRELLNFGHTMGHALEAAAGYGTILHGEAVAFGLRAAVAISRGRGWLKDGAVDRLLALLPPVKRPRGVSRAQLLRPLSKDKKVRDGKNVFILLKEIGKPERVNDVGRGEIERALDSLEEGR